MTVSKLKKELDKWFSLYIRLREATDEGLVQCFTCGKVNSYKVGMQNGHFMSRQFMATRYDEQNCQVQCVGCNMFKFGEQFKFSLALKSISIVNVSTFAISSFIIFGNATHPLTERSIDITHIIVKNNTKYLKLSLALFLVSSPYLNMLNDSRIVFQNLLFIIFLVTEKDNIFFLFNLLFYL